MKKLLLALLSSPALFASIMPVLVMANHANAAELTITGPKNREHACVKNPHGTNLICVRVKQAADAASPAPATTVRSQQPSDNKAPMLDISEKESDEAIALFGCDCPACVNALRALRGLQPVT